MVQPIYQIFSQWLEYPTDNLKTQLTVQLDFVTQTYPNVEPFLADFINFIQTTPTPNLEEIYTSTFDLNPTCYPYLGYQLFGDGYQRGEFLVKLKEKYQQHNFTYNSPELPDHLTIVLEFLGQLKPEQQLTQELINDGLVPALEKIKAGFKEENPYGQLLESLLIIVQPTLNHGTEIGAVSL
jgi:nitrate reductase molybdenum cofactor assembly chaperone NarJ/NarW